jgi:hypothetical protein
MPETSNPSAKGFALIVVLSVQALVWLAIGIGIGFWLAK